LADVKVKTELTLDDLASDVLKRIQDGFKSTDAEQQKAQSGLAEFGKQFASTFAAVNLMPAIGQIRRFAEEVVGVARDADDAAQNIAGMLAGTAGYSWRDAREEGERMHEEIVGMAVDIGQSSKDIEAGFKGIMTWMGGGAKAYAFANEQLRSMTTIANVMGFSTDMIAQNVGQMAAGFVRTRSPLFALLRGTGIFSDDITKIVKEWQELTEEQRMQKLAYAIGKVSENLGEAGPTLSDMVTMMKEGAGLVVESFGGSLLKEVKPAMADLIADMKNGRGEMQRYARVLGRDVGHWVKEAAGKIKEGFEYIQTHADEIKAAVVDAFEKARAVVSWILEHKEEIAIAFGAYAAKPALGAAAGVAGAAWKSGAAGGAVFGMKAPGGAGGGAYGLVALSAAALGTAAALDQLSQLLDELKGEEAKNAAARKAALEKMSLDLREWDEAQAHAFAEIGRGFVESAGAINMTTAQAEAAVSEMRAAHEAGVSMAQKVDAAAMQIENIKDKLESDYASERMELFGAGLSPESLLAALDEYDEKGLQAVENLHATTEYIGNAFQQAIDSGNQAQAQYIANVLAGSSEVQDAFLQSGVVTRDAMVKLADMVQGSAAGFAQRLMDMFTGGPKGLKTPKGPSFNMSGGQTFKITQDFRDSDPNQVLVMFRRDLAAAATRRLQARGASPFGT
jgi:hypothetical protein